MTAGDLILALEAYDPAEPVVLMYYLPGQEWFICLETRKVEYNEEKGQLELFPGDLVERP